MITGPDGDAFDRAAIQVAVEIAEQVSRHELRTRRVEVRGDETGQLLQALERMTGSLVQVVSTVRDGSSAIANASQEIASGNAHLSDRTEHQASNVQRTAATMQQLAEAVRQSAESAQHARTPAAQAAEVARMADTRSTRWSARWRTSMARPGRLPPSSA